LCKVKVIDTDHELLELAYRAWAPGLNYIRLINDAGRDYWNPLEDNGDAFRLAVKLRIAVDFDGIENGTIQAMQTDRSHWEIEPYGTDPYAAARRAIVRAAAEIGRNMR
jgi:hypothetical protein